MLKRTLRRTLPTIWLFVIAVCVPAISNGEPFTRITPQWVNDNPGRLELSSGAAVNGSDGYTFRLLTDNRRRFTVLTRVSRQTDKGPQPLIDTNVRSNEIAKFVMFNVSVWPAENLNVSFHVVEEEPLFDGGKITGFKSSHEYELRLDDFLDALGELPPVDFKAVALEAKSAVERKP